MLLSRAALTVNVLLYAVRQRCQEGLRLDCLAAIEVIHDVKFMACERTLHRVGILTARAMVDRHQTRSQQRLRPTGWTRPAAPHRLPFRCRTSAAYLAKPAGVSSGICVAIGVLPRVKRVTCTHAVSGCNGDTQRRRLRCQRQKPGRLPCIRQAYLMARLNELARKIHSNKPCASCRSEAV